MSSAQLFDSELVAYLATSLLIGFTFFKAKDTIQGTQNKLFARLTFNLNSILLTPVFTGNLYGHHSFGTIVKSAADSVSQYAQYLRDL